MVGLAGFEGVRRALRQPNFGIYVAGNSVSLIGTWMQRIGVGWLAWELTQSGGWLGLIAFADLFPSVFVGPIAGAIADRASRLRIIAVAQTLAMLQAVALFLLTVTGHIDIWVLFALVLANGIVVGFNQPSRLALIPSLVPREDLSTAVAVNAIVFNLARFIGPAIAGALIVSSGVAAVFAANGVTFFAFLLALSRIRLPPEQQQDASELRRSLLAEVADGVRYTVRHPGIGPLLLLMVVLSVCVRPFVELLPGFAAEVFGRGAAGLAMLSSTVGIGAVVSGLWLAQRGRTHGLTRLTLLSTLASAIAVLTFAATDRFWVALPCVAAAGVAMIVSGVGAQTLLQLAVETSMRGRVMSLYGLVFRAGPAAGALVMGLASEAVGLRWPLVAGTLVTAVVWAWTWRRQEAITTVLEPVAPPS